MRILSSRKSKHLCKPQILWSGPNGWNTTAVFHLRCTHGNSYSSRYKLARSWSYPTSCYCRTIGPKGNVNSKQNHLHLVRYGTSNLLLIALTLRTSGCGPLGLLVIAVAKAYGV